MGGPPGYKRSTASKPPRQASKIDQTIAEQIEQIRQKARLANITPPPNPKPVNHKIPPPQTQKPNLPHIERFGKWPLGDPRMSVLTTVQRGLYAVVHGFASLDSGVCTASRAVLQEETGLSSRGLRINLKAMERKRALLIERDIGRSRTHHKTNRILPLSPSSFTRGNGNPQPQSKARKP